MKLINNGLVKVMEECGELVQVCAKMVQYPDQDEHPDKQGYLLERLENEIADVLATLAYATTRLGLKEERIRTRAHAKTELFESWEAEDKQAQD